MANVQNERSEASSKAAASGEDGGEEMCSSSSELVVDVVVELPTSFGRRIVGGSAGGDASKPAAISKCHEETIVNFSDTDCHCVSFPAAEKAAADGGGDDGAERKRKWTQVQGRHRFCCDGRVIMSQQISVFYFTIVFILGGMALFLFFDGPDLWTKVHPALPIVSVLLLLMVLSNLFRTSFSDPGIVPRAGAAEAAELERQFNLESNPGGEANQYKAPPRTREVEINGQMVKLKYCFTCKLFRPPRSSHCSICDSCVLNFDHHCPWVGNCVGSRNYRYFYFFVVSLAILCLYVFACVIVHIVILSQNEENFLNALQKSPGSLVVLLICFFSIWSILGLAGFHTYLLTSNQTTNEDIKGTFSAKRNPDVTNPYSRRNMFGNCCVVLCGPEPPSLIDRRGFVVSEPVFKVKQRKKAAAGATEPAPPSLSTVVSAIANASSTPTDGQIAAL